MFFFRGFRDFSRREVHFMNGMSRANADAFPAQSTCAEVDVCQVVFEGYGLKWAFFHALATSDTSHCTGFAGDISLVLVHAANEDSPIFRPFVSQLDDVSRTGFHASTTSHALLVSNDR